MKSEFNSAPISNDQVVTLLEEKAQLQARVDSLQSQLDWFKRQLFGRKSEKQIEPNPHQQELFERKESDSQASTQAPTNVAEHKRRKKKPVEDSPDDSGLRFDSSVPVQQIDIPSPELQNHPDKYEVISEKTTYRLAQRPAAYVVLKYVRKVVKEKTTQTITTPPAPTNVLGNSFADVSFIAGMLVDKFQYHLPLYRQHQRLQQGGVTLSRATLTQLSQKGISLLKPIYDALFDSILLSRVLALDETPIKYSRKSKGKMKNGYYWPLYGDQDEIVFHFSPSRGSHVIKEILGDYEGTLLTDGYRAYETYANKTEHVTRAQCWSHARRCFDKALTLEPDQAQYALACIGALYEIEEHIRTHIKSGTEKRQLRQTQSKKIVDQFFEWVGEQRQRADLLNSNPLSKALQYVAERERAMRVFLENPDVAIDTNHLERNLRPIPMGRKAWLFCWTETGAEHVGVIQSLICSCKLHGVNPYEYLVDVLQRVAIHPAADVGQLIPRAWKTRFAENPLRSDLDGSRPAGALV